ncbi:MAG TPA: NAD+ synthase [Planctomycetaceae bacterium]|nr:NAD+ synthase [Planctomycetaceae bacterium]
MKISLAQLNPIVGDLKGNSELIREAARRAVTAGADLLVVSELAVSGYPPKDLLLREGFVSACDRIVQELARAPEFESLAAIVGHPSNQTLPPRCVANAASLIHNGQILDTTHKTLLPTYDVFDEHRYFRPASEIASLDFKGRKLGVHICEDAWWGEEDTTYHAQPFVMPDPVRELSLKGAECFINLSASPFERDKRHRRERLVRAHVQKYGKPFLFINQVGGNDDLVFDGQSFVLDADGAAVLHMKSFESDQQLIDLDNLPEPIEVSPHTYEQDLLDALILGLRDYMRKCGFTDCVLGLSGGVDSALATYIAARAVGPERVHCLMMPSRYSSEHSVSDSRKLIAALGVDSEIIPIDEIHQAYERTPVVGDDLKLKPLGLPDQNLQARIRGACVMLRSNTHGWIALATGNKSELAVGYCTIYGDMAGGFAVLSDLFKRDVYALCRYINEYREKREVIPDNIITKAPSAELAPDQFDQDSLPPYPVLDAILEGLIERERSVASLCKEFPAETVRWVAGKLDRNEFKRRQMPPGIKLSQRAFGSGRRMPMAARFEHE